MIALTKVSNKRELRPTYDSGTESLEPRSLVQMLDPEVSHTLASAEKLTEFAPRCIDLLVRSPNLNDSPPTDDLSSVKRNPI
jgi:hypothetical protein